MGKDDIDFLLTDELKRGEKPDCKLNCDIKRAMREKDSKRGVSIWWVPMFGAVLSLICASFLPIIITTNSILINQMLGRFIDSTRIASIFVMVITGIGMFKFNLKEEAKI